MALTDNLAAYYKLDGNSNDSVGSNNGTDNSITYVAGKINDCANYNATGDSIVCSAINTPSAYSISFWVKMPVVPGGKDEQNFRIVNGITNDSMGFNWSHAQTEYQQAFYQRTSGGAYVPLKISGSLSANTWYHIVGVWTGTQFKIYLNGNLNATYSTTSINTIAGNLVFSSLNASGNIYQDETGIWSRELTSTEVTNLYNSGNGISYPFSTTSIKSINGLAYASIKSYNGLAMSSVKSINGLA